MANQSNEFKKGEQVEWNTPQGETEGVIEKKLTQPMEIKGHHVNASKDDPQYLVKSNKSGKKAAHKPESLEKAED